MSIQQTSTVLLCQLCVSVTLLALLSAVMRIASAGIRPDGMPTAVCALTAGVRR